jgi:hypothetical protein
MFHAARSKPISEAFNGLAGEIILGVPLKVEGTGQLIASKKFRDMYRLLEWKSMVRIL